MELNFIHDEREFLKMEKEWNQLLSRSILDVPFLRHEFQSIWWQTLGGGEWAEGELWIAAGRRENGELLGIAPFFRNQSDPDQPKLMLIGSKEIADYLDLIVTPDDHHSFISALAVSLQDLPLSTWKYIDLHNMPDGSPTLNALSTLAGDLGWEVETERLQPCPWLDLEGDWDTYLSHLKKKQRHELRRKLRRAEASEKSIHFHIVNKQEELQMSIHRLLILMTSDRQKRDFLTVEMSATLREIITAAFEHGWLMLTFLESEGEPIAAYLNFDYDGRIWIYNSGINPDFMNLSPGWVLMGNIIQWAIAHGRSAIDFLRGDESYKYQLGGQNRFIHRLILSRQG
jgi:CelD/BcsL family acetyltransferase involved in cellulose biosynthesis